MAATENMTVMNMYNWFLSISSTIILTKYYSKNFTSPQNSGCFEWDSPIGRGVRTPYKSISIYTTKAIYMTCVVSYIASNTNWQNS